jgi:hypothetical protein
VPRRVGQCTRPDADDLEALREGIVRHAERVADIIIRGITAYEDCR